MSPEIPEYYRHLAQPEKQTAPAPEKEKKPRGMPIPESARQQEREQLEEQKQEESQSPLSENVYKANSFTINLPDEWTDKTIFTLTGPATDDIQHNITVNAQSDLEVESLLEFAESQFGTLESELKGCRLLLNEPCQLTNGLPAHKAIFVWWPAEELRLYQEQIYVLHGNTGFTLTASFTKKTRKTIGPEVERAMLSFQPL